MSLRRLLLLVTVSAACGLLATGYPIAEAQAVLPATLDPAGVPFHLDPLVKRTFVPLGRARAFLYEPLTSAPRTHIGVLVMHSGIDYTTFSACNELAKRGYLVLCGANSGGGLDGILFDVKSSMEYLRSYPGVKRVVLWGHSGGATLMTAYQMIAENGVQACQGPEKLLRCADTLTAFPPADGLILADSNWGNAAMALFSLDPAVVAEDNGTRLNPDLDLFSPRNGFNPAGSDYSGEFIHRFQHAVGIRENALIRMALDRLALIDAGKGRFVDDEPFVVPGASGMAPNNKLFAEDVRLLSHTRKPWPLVHADGSVTTGIVHSVRVPEGQGSLTPVLAMGAINSTVRSFLKNSAIRVSETYGFDEESVYGVDWESSYASPPGNIAHIHVPLLIMGMTAHWEYLAAETLYERSASSDRSLAFIEGADHNYQTCRPCEKIPGQYGDTLRTTYDYADQWLSRKGRFPDPGT